MALLPLLILVTISLANTSPRTNDLSGSVELLGIDSNNNNKRGQQHPHRQRLLVFDGKYFDSKTNAEPVFRTRATPSTPSPTTDSSPAVSNILADNNNNNGPNSNSRKQQQQTGAEETTKPLTNSSTSTTARTTTNGTKYKVIRVVPENEGHLKLLERLELNGADLELNFWTSPIRIKAGVDIMLPAEKVPLLRRYLHKHRMHTEIIIDDVEQLIIQRERQIASSRRRAARLLADDPLAGGGDAIRPTMASADHSNTIDFYHYNSYAQMVAWMRSLAKRYPKFVQFISVGKSHEGRAIDGLEIGSRGFRKRAFWIDGGIHAREWAAPHTALYFIHQLTSRYGHDEDITRLVNEITWIVVPLLNPDGYEYTRSSTNPNIRLWRKNRSPTHCVRDQWGRQRCCKGVDLNRNFDFHFKESGSSDDPCSEIYQGKNAFSEPEAKAVRDAILSNRYRGRIDGFITLHTYSQIWIHPYGHKRDSYPGDVQDLYAVGKKATAALTRLYGTKYVIGSGADTLYPASGGSEDWAKESANIKFVYLLELRPDEKNWDGFILDETQLIPTATETWAGVRVVADAIIQRARARRVATGSGNVAATMHRIAGLPQYQPLGTVVVTNDDLRQQQQQMPMQILSKEEASSSPNVVATGFGEWPTKSATRDGEEDTMKPQQQQQKKCTDRRRACRRWVMESEHICQAVPVFMGEQCARSCGFC